MSIYVRVQTEKYVRIETVHTQDLHCSKDSYNIIMAPLHLVGQGLPFVKALRSDTPHSEDSSG